MHKSLAEIATIHNGTGYANNPPGDDIPIYGTGGLMGYTSIALNHGPAVLSGRKGSINNPIYVEGDFWNVDTIFCIKTKDDVDIKWLFYNFQNTDLRKLNEATGVPSVTSKALYKLKFTWFELPEQHKIARILSTADAVIEKTQKAISKYRAVKQGMLNDLFTRGIDPHTKTLRPKPEDAPELYKDSPLGKMPLDWDVERLGSRAIIDYGKSQKQVASIDGVIPVYGTGGLMEFATDFLFDGESILIGRKGTIDKPFYLSGKFWVVDTTYFLSFFSGNIKWLFYKLVNFGLGKLNEATGVPSLNRELFYKIVFSFPERDEQDEIVNRISVIDAKTRTEQTYLAKTRSIKAGLMADLLSGKKRVEIVDEASR